MFKAFHGLRLADYKIADSRSICILNKIMSIASRGQCKKQGMGDIDHLPAVDNELFYRGNTRMLFGDARKSLAALVNAVKQVG